MALFPSLPETPHLADVFKAFPEQVRPLLAYHDSLLRAESPLTVAQRELIATYVSGINACSFCFGAHRLYANVFGVSDAVIDGLMEDIDTASIEDKMKPILHYVTKLTRLEPLRAADAKAVYMAGWSERALYDAVQICALFNMMNRIIEGTGVSFDYSEAPPSKDDMEARKTRSYSDFGDMLGLD